MAQRCNHYEAAFEDYLRSERVPCIAVHEGRRAVSRDASLKNVDYLVSPRVDGLSWLVDVKGRRFPAGQRRKQYWKNWVTRDDLDSLACWRSRFGVGFDAALVFAYHLTAEAAPVAPEAISYYRGRPYAFIAARLTDYAALARPLSARWDTVAVPTRAFRAIARPIAELLDPPACADQPLRGDFVAP